MDVPRQSETFSKNERPRIHRGIAGASRVAVNHNKRKKKPTHINQLKQSKFLARTDVARPILVTIKAIQQENVAMENEPPEMKYVLIFNECAKPFVLNWTNSQLIAKALGSEETDNWLGKQIVLYDDPNVSFGGKLVGGIRVRAPRNRAAAPAPAPTPAPEPPPIAPTEENDVPF